MLRLNCWSLNGNRGFLGLCSTREVDEVRFIFHTNTLPFEKLAVSLKQVYEGHFNDKVKLLFTE